MKIEHILQKLISISSPSGKENEIAQYIFEWAKERSLPVHRQDSNVVIAFQTGSDRCLIFNGHMDTVSAGNLSSWNHDPLSGTIVDGNLFGLGASDMKSSLACYLALAHELLSKPPPIDIVFSFVVEEETSSAGSRSFVEYFEREFRKSYRTCGCIIGEPTDLTYTELGHRGSHFVKLRSNGRSGHASQSKEMSPLAIPQLLQMLTQVKALEKQWAERFPDPTLGEPLATITALQTARTSPNQTPEWAEAVVDFRTTPRLSEVLLSELSSALGPAVEVTSLDTPTQPTVTKPDASVVRALQQVAPGIELRIARGANDCYLFNAVGIPAVTFGPGLKTTIHRPNEYLPVVNLERALSVYRALTQTF